MVAESLRTTASPAGCNSEAHAWTLASSSRFLAGRLLIPQNPPICAELNCSDELARLQERKEKVESEALPQLEAEVARLKTELEQMDKLKELYADVELKVLHLAGYSLAFRRPVAPSLPLWQHSAEER